MRLFLGSFAAVPDAAKIVEHFSPYFDMRPTPPRNFHLTWYFLGEHPSPAPFIDRLRELDMIPRLPLPLHTVDLFDRDNPRILHVAPTETIPKILHEKIAILLGLKPDERFRPHVTLARIDKIKADGWREALADLKGLELGQIESTIYLIESRLTPDGPVYLPIEAF
ncbi:MAG: hypothetical protein GXO33_04420 [Epsilonproteobacteria bacterium]|nr:hypothetical protein [Campylobacterota bacterium]